MGGQVCEGFCAVLSYYYYCSLTAAAAYPLYPLEQRLMRDFKRLQQDPPQGVNGSPNPDNIMQWNAVIFGPEDTPWDGGEPGCARGGPRGLACLCLDLTGSVDPLSCRDVPLDAGVL